jgi:hypothetical protein
MTRHQDAVASRFTPVDDDTASCERTCAKLLIYSTQMSPQEISQHLRLEPTSQTYARTGHIEHSSIGESIDPSVGESIDRPNGWFLSSEDRVRSKDLRTHLNWLLGVLLEKQEELKSLQDTFGVKMYVYCPWWAHFSSGGPTLWPEQMLLLANLNLECSFDFVDYSDVTGPLAEK